MSFDLAKEQACRNSIGCGAGFLNAAFSTTNRAVGWYLENMGTNIGKSVTIASAAGLAFWGRKRTFGVTNTGVPADGSGH